MEAEKGLIFNIQKFSIHDGPGIRTTVFFKGCPLHCKWCSNPESQKSAVLMMGDVPDSRLYTVEEILGICLEDRPFYEESGGGVTLSGGDPLAQPGFAGNLLDALRAEGISTAIETAGCADSGVFESVASRAGTLLFDVKHYDAARHREGCGTENTLILKNLRLSIERGFDILPRLPVIPGFNAETEDAAGIATLLCSLGLARIQLLPFHQLGDRKYTLLGLPYTLRGVKQLHPEDLTAYREVFTRQGIDAFF